MEWTVRTIMPDRAASGGYRTVNLSNEQVLRVNPYFDALTTARRSTVADPQFPTTSAKKAFWW